MGMKYIRKKRSLEMLIDDNPDLKKNRLKLWLMRMSVPFLKRIQKPCP